MQQHLSITKKLTLQTLFQQGNQSQQLGVSLIKYPQQLTGAKGRLLQAIEPAIQGMARLLKIPLLKSPHQILRPLKTSQSLLSTGLQGSIGSIGQQRRPEL